METEIPPELIDSVRPTDKFKVQCMKFMCGYWPSTNPNKDAKYIPSPAFIRFVDHDKSQYLPMIDSEKYCKINHLMDDTLPITSDFDNLYNQIIQAMT